MRCADVCLDTAERVRCRVPSLSVHTVIDGDPAQADIVRMD